MPDPIAMYEVPGERLTAMTNEITELRRSLADKDAEIARLTAELDSMRDVPVEYVTEAGLEAAMTADPHRQDGTILRETDGGKRAFEWKAAAKTWEQIG